MILLISVAVAFPGKAVRVVQGNVNGNVKSSADVEAVGSLVASISTQSLSSEGVSLCLNLSENFDYCGTLEDLFL